MPEKEYHHKSLKKKKKLKKQAYPDTTKAFELFEAYYPHIPSLL
jgi:hypothetical protein